MHKDKHLTILCLFALIVIQIGIPTVGAIAPGTRVRVEPADLLVDPHESFIVEVVIEEASNLGAFQFSLLYDPATLQLMEVTLGAFLESTGNTAIPIGPEMDNAQGRMTFGAISFGSAVGASGTGVLAAITCVAQGRGSTALGLREVQVLDAAASGQQVTVEDGQVLVRGAEASTPTVTATFVPAATATATATSVPVPTATPVRLPTVTFAPVATPAPTVTIIRTLTTTPKAVGTSAPAVTALPSPTPTFISPAAKTPTESLPVSPSPVPSVSVASTAARPMETEVSSPLSVPTVEATQPPATVPKVPTLPVDAPSPPSPVATSIRSSTSIPSPTPLSTIPVPAATSSSSGAMLGLMLAALVVAMLAVFFLNRRPGS